MKGGVASTHVCLLLSSLSSALRKQPTFQSTMKRTPSKYDTIELGDTLRLLDAQYASLTSVVDIIRKKWAISLELFTVS
jgi:hypothetical protein